MRFLCHGWTCSAGFSEGGYVTLPQRNKLSRSWAAHLCFFLQPSCRTQPPPRLETSGFCPKNEELTQSCKELWEEESDQGKNGITQEALAVRFIWHQQELIQSAKELPWRKWLCSHLNVRGIASSEEELLSLAQRLGFLWSLGKTLADLKRLKIFAILVCVVRNLPLQACHIMSFHPEPGTLENDFINAWCSDLSLFPTTFQL